MVSLVCVVLQEHSSSVADPHFGTDPDADPGGPKTYGFYGSGYESGTLTFTSFFKEKSQSQNSRNEGFSYYFFLMMGGSGAGSILVINGSGCGSGRPENIRIRIQMWVEIDTQHCISATIFSFLYYEDTVLFWSSCGLTETMWWWETGSSSHPSTRVSRYSQFNPNIMANMVVGDRVILTPVSRDQQVYAG